MRSIVTTVNRLVICVVFACCVLVSAKSMAQVDNVALAVKQRRVLDLQETAELQEATQRALANLPPKYQWLKDWEYV